MKRILVYALQSSGASWVTYMLAQKSHWVVIPDILTQVPTVADFDDLPKTVEGIIVKATVFPGESLQWHQSRFEPDETILVRRNEADNYRSLSRKWYGTSIDEKFAIWRETVANRSLYDRIIDYEQFIPQPITRSLQSITEYNISVSEWCRRGCEPIHINRGNGRKNRRAWGCGRIRELV